MIYGGSTDGDSNWARKAWSRRESLGVDDGRMRNEHVLSFDLDDLQGVNVPHNDALVIQAWITNYNVMRVFIELGSSVNFIFKETRSQMDLQGYKLE